MNCINCGSSLRDDDQEFCPHCGFNIKVQRKVEYLSKYYYNQGLEKASIRDLSGAISCLKQSLTFNKNNISARNLLGLVYFETGEVVAALSEWVISKNLQPKKNIASDYIERLQANPNRLEAINETIRKYNQALSLCREGHDDMAALRLRKILAQNPKLIKGYHLLALIQMKDHEWGKARRVLKRAAKIDKTNTTTLRFLKEVDEQTGVSTQLEQKKGLFGALTRSSGKKAETDAVDLLDDRGETRLVIPQTAYRSRSGIPLFLGFMGGIAAGALGFWLLVMPAIRQGIYRQANDQIVKYSESMASQGAELSKAQNAAEASGSEVEQTEELNKVLSEQNDTFRYLLLSYISYMQGDLNEAALDLQKVYEVRITDEMKGIYNFLCQETGVTGKTGGGASISENAEESTDLSEWEDAGYDEYTDDGYEEEYYEEDDAAEDEYYEEDTYTEEENWEEDVTYYEEEDW